MNYNKFTEIVTTDFALFLSPTHTILCVCFWLKNDNFKLISKSWILHIDWIAKNFINVHVWPKFTSICTNTLYNNAYTLTHMVTLQLFKNCFINICDMKNVKIQYWPHHIEFGVWKIWSNFRWLVKFKTKLSNERCWLNSKYPPLYSLFFFICILISCLFFLRY